MQSNEDVRKEDINEVNNGLWKPDSDKGECGEDLNLKFIICDDEDGCLAKRNEFPFMVGIEYNETTASILLLLSCCTLPIIYYLR